MTRFGFYFLGNFIKSKGIIDQSNFCIKLLLCFSEELKIYLIE
ncbi:hypothetical protein LEP1GSC059_4611 [Leptospira noguchii serovar Panama str. CZ214]|uniref:Uncharacterized protein n=1 Tax=Leptospira noguchii serovar Panama str. CZ214 TaxID=1001595 RepID=T0GNW0_9LEPT|nr:hypothetical protein LEP1GSC059_4611 [Leptospira noguchii serovar Panama str. CZ214]